MNREYGEALPIPLDWWIEQLKWEQECILARKDRLAQIEAETGKRVIDCDRREVRLKYHHNGPWRR